MVPPVDVRRDRASYPNSAQAPPGIANCPPYNSVHLNNGMIPTFGHGMNFGRCVFLTRRVKSSLFLMMVVTTWDWAVLWFSTRDTLPDIPGVYNQNHRKALRYARSGRVAKFAPRRTIEEKQTKCWSEFTHPYPRPRWD